MVRCGPRNAWEAQRSMALAERGLVIANGRVTAGKASPVEATRAQVQLSEIRLERSRAEIGVSDAYRRLAAITGSANIGFERVESGALNTPALPSATQLLARLESTAELRLAELQIQQREAGLGLEKAQRIPDLDVSIGSQYDASVRERVNLVGVSMPIPLFNRNQGNVLAASTLPWLRLNSGIGIETPTRFTRSLTLASYWLPMETSKS